MSTFVLFDRVQCVYVLLNVTMHKIGIIQRRKAIIDKNGLCYGN